MDIATLIGLLFGIGIISGTIVMGGGAMAFVHIPSMCIVIGGMLCSVLIHFSMGQFLSIFSVIKKTFMVKIMSPSELIQQMVNFAAVNRRDGALALEEQIRKINNIKHSFLVQILRSRFTLCLLGVAEVLQVWMQTPG